MNRSVSVVAFVCGGIVFPFFAFAAFVGPSSAPPYLNTKGLVWDIPAASTPTPETFVDVTGDIMTGQLHLAIPSGNAIFAEALGSGSIAIKAIGESYGAWFQGNTYGVEAHGNTAGLYAVDDNDGSAASIAAGGYGVQAVGSRIGIFGSGSDAGLYGIDSSTVKYGYVGYGSYSFFGNGDLSVPNNDRSSCVTVGVASGAGTFQCTGAKFMSGVRKNSSNVVDGIVCCDL